MKSTKALNKAFLIGMLFMLACTGVQDGDHSRSKDGIAGLFARGKKEHIAAPGYKKWVEDKESGLVASKRLNDIVFECLFKPNAYEALLRLQGNDVTKESLEQTKNDLEGLQFFTFKISTADNKGELLKYELPNTDEYYRRIEYCSFRMQNDIRLIDEGDTLNCVLFHFERVFSIAPEATFVLGFEDHRSKEDKQNGRFNTDKIICFDDGIFNSGIVNLGIQKTNLNQIPELDIAIN